MDAVKEALVDLELMSRCRALVAGRGSFALVPAAKTMQREGGSSERLHCPRCSTPFESAGLGR